MWFCTPTYHGARRAAWQRVRAYTIYLRKRVAVGKEHAYQAKYSFLLHAHPVRRASASAVPRRVAAKVPLAVGVPGSRFCVAWIASVTLSCPSELPWVPGQPSPRAWLQPPHQLTHIEGPPNGLPLDANGLVKLGRPPESTCCRNYLERPPPTQTQGLPDGPRPWCNREQAQSPERR